MPNIGYPLGQSQSPTPRNPNSLLGAQTLGAQTYSPPRMAICVSDVERLAKAGVQVKWEDIASQVYPDDTRKEHPKLIDALRERLYAPVRAKNDFSDPRRLYGIYDAWVATAYCDKVYVFAMWPGRAPMILEDDINLYPSDGLVTKIRLIEDTTRSQNLLNEDQGVVQAPTTQVSPKNFRQ